jgi:hypothetical protein
MGNGQIHLAGTSLVDNRGNSVSRVENNAFPPWPWAYIIAFCRVVPAKWAKKSHTHGFNFGDVNKYKFNLGWGQY